jgi:3-isopropylmalate/(R)-2-methylmalate dehydratase small subunit
VLICNSDKINDGDELEVDLKAGTIKDITNGSQLTFGKIPDIMLAILDQGGLIPYIKKYGDFKLKE